MATESFKVAEVTPRMDWGQVVLNGGPPCFHVEGPQFCGRAERWPGHGNAAFHAYVSLDGFLESQTPLCPVHRDLDRKNSLELTIGGNSCVACSLNEREQLLTIVAAATGADGSKDSLTCLTQIVNERSALQEIAAAARAFVWEPENWEAYQHSKDSDSVAWPPEFLLLAQAVEKQFGPMPHDADCDCGSCPARAALTERE